MEAPAETPVDRLILTARRVALIAGLSLPLAFATASYGQPAAQSSQSGPPAAAHHYHRSPEEIAAARAARLRTLLQLSPDQEPALTAFLASMKPPAGATGQERENRSAERALPAPQRMERMLARMDEARAEMGRKLEALKTFYSQLTPAQQKAFDALDLGHGHGRHHGWNGGKHHGGAASDHTGDGTAGADQPHN
jgi:hypothetical protein